MITSQFFLSAKRGISFSYRLISNGWILSGKSSTCTLIQSNCSVKLLNPHSLQTPKTKPCLFLHFLRCRDETGCEHFMLGRSAMANPLLPRQIARDMGVSKSLLPNLGETIHLKGETEYSVWLPRLIEFASLMREYSPELPEKVVLNRLKQWIRMLHLRRDVDWFDRFKRLESLESAFSMGFEPATI
jgi:hypothetical protein